MRIDGYVSQIIAPKDHKNYFGHGFADAVKGKYVLTLCRKDVPRRQLAYLRWFIRHHKEWGQTFWRVVIDECSFREGQEVSLDVDPFLPLVEVWIEHKH